MTAVKEALALFDCLLEFDDRVAHPGKVVAGVDEAGRGPLAGPVVAAAVILPADVPLEEFGGLNDSKALSAEKRDRIFERIQALCSSVGVGIADAAEIDRKNILAATLLAMKRAVEQMGQSADLVLVDGLHTPAISTHAQAIVKGDSLSASIAAASIVAKVTRDRMMEEVHEEHPHYRFDRHKGYGSRLHLAALRIFGPCPYHRKSFAPVAQAVKPTKPTKAFKLLYKQAQAAKIEEDLHPLFNAHLQLAYMTDDEQFYIKDYLKSRLKEFS